MNNLKIFLQNKIKTFKSNVAIKNADKFIGYDLLDDTANKISEFLSNNGTSSNIGIFGKNDIFTYQAVIGVVYANKAYIPLSQKVPVDKLNSIIEDGSINTVITISENVSFIKDTMPNINTIIVIDHADVKVIKVSKLNEQFSESELAYILFTSGSTGQPKGVMVTKENVLSYIETKQNIYKFREGLNFSQTAQLSFDISTFEIFICFSTGGILNIISDEDLLCPSEYIINNNINVWYSVPTFAVNMQKIGALESDCFPSLQYSFFCGEPMPKETAMAWLNSSPNTILDNLYGPTEATVDVSRFSFTQELFHKDYYNGILPLGKPINSQKVIIVDEDNCVITKSNIVGEIYLWGTQLSNGYLNNTQKNKETFIDFNFDGIDGIWYKSGDLAFYNETKDLEYHSRKDTQIKISGKRIEIGELEYIFKSKCLLKNIIIIPKKGEQERVKELIAFVLIDLNKEEIQSIQKKAMQFLDKLFIPRKFICIEDYPKTTSGKIDRKALENRI